MKSACVFYNQKSNQFLYVFQHFLDHNICIIVNWFTFLGLLRIPIVLQHIWVISMNYMLSPFIFVTSGMYLIVRLKDPGTISIIKVELPVENNQIEVQIKDNEKREVLNAQGNDESNDQISLDQFKDGLDNKIQKYNTKQQQQQQTDNQNILSGRGMISSPFSEQVKINTQNKQTCIITTNAVMQYSLAIERRFCMQFLNEQPIRAKHCQQCKKCIPMFDHHCPLIGVCVREKNKLLFLIYLLIQIVELIVGIRILVENIGILVVMGVYYNFIDCIIGISWILCSQKYYNMGIL